MSDVYRFERFQVEPQRRALSRDGVEVPITSKAFDILLYLVQHPNRIVTRQELMRAVWPDTTVEESNLTQNMSLLRKALAEHGNERFVVTVARQGYQFAGDVTTESSTLTTPQPQRLSDDGRRTISGDHEARNSVGAEDSTTPGVQSSLPWRNATLITGVVLLALVVAFVAWRGVNSGPGSKQSVRLAVLPFENFTGDSAQEYLVDGLTEELTAQLARLDPRRLEVIARTSAMQYKHTQKRVDEIGRDLGVRYTIESSLRKSANQVRVTVQLIRAEDGSHVWANNFDFVAGDILRLEDDVAGAVAREIQLQLTPMDRARLAQRTSSQPAAVDALLRGIYARQYRHRGKDDWLEAKRDFDQAIALDSGYALAWAWLADTYRRAADRRYLPPDTALRTARAAIERALALDPNLADAYVQLSRLQDYVDWDWAGASASAQRAVTLDPGNADAISEAGMVARELGRSDEAIADGKRAIELDPMHAGLIASLGQSYFDAGRLGEAAQSLEKDSARFPDPIASTILADVYLAQGRTADAAAVVEREGPTPFQMIGRVLVLDAQQRHKSADSLLHEVTTLYADDGAFEIAEIYATRGDADHAFTWLEHAYATHDQGLAEFKADPMLERVRRDPRYAAFLAKMHFPPG